MNKVRLGIIGLGAQGGTYAAFINEGKVANLEIGAICDIDPEKKHLLLKNILTYHFMNIILICWKAEMLMLS